MIESPARIHRAADAAINAMSFPRPVASAISIGVSTDPPFTAARTLASFPARKT
jgi:hypothetical protein